jgi:hypothetical protein
MTEARVYKTTAAARRATKAYRSRNVAKIVQMNNDYYADNKERLKANRRARYAKQKKLKAKKAIISTLNAHLKTKILRHNIVLQNSA